MLAIEQAVPDAGILGTSLLMKLNELGWDNHEARNDGNSLRQEVFAMALAVASTLYVSWSGTTAKKGSKRSQLVIMKPNYSTLRKDIHGYNCIVSFFQLDRIL